MEDLRYPIGKFSPPEVFTSSFIEGSILDIQNFPIAIREKVESMHQNDYLKVYREGGWNVRQVIQHCADSHLNAFTRFKLALTEDKPTIKNYNQDAWVKRKEMKEEPIEWSVAFLENLHLKWTHMLTHMTEDEFALKFVHPEFEKELSLSYLTALYSWHCKHHLGHIELALSDK